MNDIATALLLMFIFTAANHLGLVGKLEDVIQHSIPIINCPRCITFWGTLIYLMAVSHDVIGAVAISFLLAYLAVWLELVMCVIDHYYMRIYEKFISATATDTTATDAHDDDGNDAVSDMRK